MKKYLVLLLVLAFAVSMVFMGIGCKKEAVQAEEAAPAEEELKTIKMGLAMNQMDFVVFHALSSYLETNVKAEAEKRGFSVEWTMTNANGDVTKQASDIKDLLTAGCEVIFCPALDSKTIISSITEVHNAGKYFVMFFREVDESATGDQIPDATVNMDSTHQAYGAMTEVFKIMAADGIEPKEIIDVHGDIADENATNRENGFLQALAEFGWEDKVAQIVDSGHWEPEVALQNTAAALQAHPDSNCMYVATDGLLSAIQTALENVGKWAPRGDANHVYIGGTDMYPYGIELTVKKYVDGNVDVPAWQIGEKCAQLAFDLVEGKEVSKENNLVKGTVINSDNAAQVTADTPGLWGVDYAGEE